MGGGFGGGRMRRGGWAVAEKLRHGTGLVKGDFLEDPNLLKLRSLDSSYDLSILPKR